MVSCRLSYFIADPGLAKMASFLASFFLVVRPTTLPFWFTLAALIVLFLVVAGSCFQIKSSKIPIVHYLLSTKHQTDTVRDQLVNIVEHLTAKEPDIFLRSWWRPKTELKAREFWT